MADYRCQCHPKYELLSPEIGIVAWYLSFGGHANRVNHIAHAMLGIYEKTITFAP